MSYNAKEKFYNLNENSKYIRVDDMHPFELYLGLDSHGNKTLRLNEKFNIQSVKSSAKITIQQYKGEDENSILFSNIGEEDIFHQFCNDLIDTSRTCAALNGYQFLLNRYSKWKKMFASNKETLSLSEIMGLIGELIFLKDFAFPKFGAGIAILGWSGVEPTHKDFSYGSDWYEIKSISAHKNTVPISSLEQLDSINEGTLVVYKLEKMSASFNGISLNKCVQKTKELIEDEENLDVFENKLFQAGYCYMSNYDEFVFCLMGKDAYKVSKDFPKLKRDEVPNEIASVKYELIINSIEGFKVNL